MCICIKSGLIEVILPDLLLYLREGISQEDVLAHPFDAAREREKLAKRVSTRCQCIKYKVV